MSDKGTGKTTKIMEETISLLAELPETSYVIITGTHPKWLFQLQREFHAAGLVSVKFFTPSQIINGCLRGLRGVLLMDDLFDLRVGELDGLLEEQKLLRRE